MSALEHDVGAADELGLGMRQVDADGTPALLIRDGEAIRAVTATCPHAGAPLAQGIYHDGRVICPWHKAAFCVRTGAAMEPPALDSLRRWEVRVDHGRILLADPRPKAAASAAPDPRRFVIMGGGAAGAVAAQTLREAGFNGHVIMLDREGRVPYDRTVLSKYALSGEAGAEKTPLQTQAFYREQRIERIAAEVVRVDAQARRITCADGVTILYDAALLATGSLPIRPDIAGADLGHVFLLRSKANAEAILAQAERSERAVVLGTSFIAMEVAASLRERGLDVTVIGAEATPFAKRLGPEIGAAFTALHRARGVSFRLGRTVASIERSRVLLDDGEAVAADLVVIGFGVRPDTGFLSGAALNDDGGVPVDACLRMSDGLYAAGDIASFPYRGDDAPIRVEHWRVAQQQGRLAALNMLGDALRYDVVPVFWTIQYLKRLDYIGHATEWDGVVLHGDPSQQDFLGYYVKDGIVAAAAGMGRDRDTAALTELFRVRREWTAEELGEQPARRLEAMPEGRP